MGANATIRQSRITVKSGRVYIRVFFACYEALYQWTNDILHESIRDNQRGELGKGEQSEGEQLARKISRGITESAQWPNPITHSTRLRGRTDEFVICDRNAAALVFLPCLDRAAGRSASSTLAKMGGVSELQCAKAVTSSGLLREIEELVLSIPDRESREYTREAVRCYQGGTYRAAIVMAMAAAMDDLRRKIAEQASSGGTPQAVRDGAARIDQLFRDEQAFESALIDVCQQDANVFTVAEAAKMRLLLKLRHLCAHPSGHVATAEEAREAITSTIDLVLARPALFGMIAVTSLVDRLEGVVFFPENTEPATIVQGELRHLQPALFRALATRLVERVLNSAQEAARNPAVMVFGNHRTIRSNAVSFVGGMLRVGGAARDAVWHYFGRLLEHPEADLDALRVLRSDPLGVAATNTLTRERSVALMRRQISSQDSRALIRHWTESGLFSAQERIELEALAANVLLRTIDEDTLPALVELGFPTLIDTYVEKLVAQAGSQVFVEANAAIAAMQALPPAVAANVTAEQRVRYLIGVASSSDGATNYGRSARGVVTAGLGPRADFLDALRDRARTSPAEVREAPIAWLQLARLIRSSGRLDVLTEVLGVFKGHEGQSYYRTREMLDDLLAIPEVASVAQGLLAAGRAAHPRPTFA